VNLFVSVGRDTRRAALSPDLRLPFSTAATGRDKPPNAGFLPGLP